VESSEKSRALNAATGRAAKWLTGRERARSCPRRVECEPVACARRAFSAVLLALSACGETSDGAARAPTARFRDVRRVEIAGFSGSAMEPYISCDGRYLFFNNRNEPAEQTDLFLAEAAGADRFQLVGPLAGANAPPPALDAVPSLDLRGELFFISTRSYDTSLATLYQGDFREGRVESVRLVPGNVSRGQRGWLTMDAEIARDGSLLYFADARFSGGPIPDEADLVIARRTLDAFTVDDEGRRLVAALNTRALEYAPAAAADGLELFFTRLDGATPAILRATRARASDPFGAPSPIEGVSGFVEAPTLTCDGRALYFHRLDGGEFAIYRADRVDAAAASTARSVLAPRAPRGFSPALRRTLPLQCGRP
jgi:hypothetical protein